MNPFSDLKPVDDKNDGLTYDQWKAEGYQVMRGEKATGRNADGLPTFTSSQVKDSYYDYGDDDGDQYYESYPPQHYLGKGLPLP